MPSMFGSFFPADINVSGFQSNLAAATSDSGQTYVPHHPITCQSELHFDEEGSFSCEHTTVPPDDSRTKRVLIHSLASLVIELGYAFDGLDALGEPARLRDIKE